jgi:hypothetical protein
MMEDTETQVDLAANGNGDGEAPPNLIEQLRQTRVEVAEVFGKTHALSVPGYQGLLGIEYVYISSEVTEKIARDVRRETKNVNGIGSSLLSALDTMIAASRNVLVRDEAKGEWLKEDGSLSEGVRGIDTTKQVNLRTTRLAEILNYDAVDGREVVLGLFGSEHKIIEHSLLLSRWMTDSTQTMDEDFLG